MDRVALWLRWSWRDLRARMLQVAAIAAIVALGTGVYAGLSSTSSWRRASYDASYRALRAHDLHVTLAQGTYTDPARLRAALLDSPGVSDVEVRLVAPVQIDASHAGRTILVPGRLIGVDVASGSPSIDRLDPRRGRTIDAGDDGRDRLVVDYHFARHHHLPASGSLRLSGGAHVSYIGQVLSPEYFMVMSEEGTLLAEAGFAATWAPISTVQRLTNHPGAVNDAVVRLASRGHRRAAARAVESALRTRLTDVAATVTAIDDERAYRTMYDDIDGDQRLYNIFAFLILGGAAFAAFNLVGRIVEAQRREIGIGMALGVPRSQIAIRPLLVGFQVAALGAVLGVAVGIGVSVLMRGVLVDFLPLPDWRTPFELSVYARGWALGLALPFVASVVPIVRAVRVLPVDAIRTGPTTVKRRGLAGALRWLTIGNSIRQMPARNVLRAPRRALLTALAIAAAIATLIGVVGMVDSFLDTIDHGEAAVLGDRPDRLTVSLAGFAPKDTPPLRAITGAPGVGRAEPGLQVGGRLRRGGHELDVLIRLLPFDSKLWRPDPLRGRIDTTRIGIVIAEKAARDLHVSPGDIVTLRHPRRNGTGYRWVESRVPVEAIHRIPYRFIAFMDTHDASLMNLDGIYNTVAVAPAHGIGVTRLQRTLFAAPGVGSVQPVRAFAETIRDAIRQSLDILRVVEAAVLVLALLIAFNSTAIGVDERAREHATMFAFGVPLPTVLRNTVVESVMVGTLGTGIGIGFGAAIVRYITDILLPATLPDVAVHAAVSSTTIVTAAVLGVLAVAIAPLFTVRRMRRMDIPATLRVVE